MARIQFKNVTKRYGDVIAVNDLNLEIIFQNVTFVDFENRFLRGLFSPRPFIGGTYNNEGKTHTAYAGLNWGYQFRSGIFIALGLGMAYHTGNLHQATYQCPPGGGCSLPGNRAYVNTGEPSLGSEVLFREGLDIGYRFYGGHGISLYAAHISNAGVIDHDNDGMNFVGVRYSYSFD